MGERKLSISIPYKQRLHNIRVAFEALARQTMDSSEFEVIVGAMEHSPEYLELCREFAGRIDVVSVVSSRPFEIPQARNLAMRQATGEVVVQMDADTLLPEDALQNLYDRYFAFGQQICVVGQVVGYGNNNDGDVAFVETRPFEHYAESLRAVAATRGKPRDPRFQVDHVIPWAFAWTGLIALPTRVVRKHALFFDESFQGWGVDDLEWGYRICASGTPISLCEDVYALHLPHSRDTAANRETEGRNFRRFLEKWPRPDVELVCAVNDIEGNALFRDFHTEIQALGGGRGHSLGIARGTIDGADVLVAGIALDAQRRPIDGSMLSIFDGPAAPELLPLAGLALPYEDKSIEESRMLPALSRFSPKYRDVALAELDRVSRKVIPPARG